MVNYYLAEDARTIDNAKVFMDATLAYEAAIGKKSVIVASDGDDDNIVGVLVYELLEDAGSVRIDWLMVRSDMRGQGVALRLHTILFSTCAEIDWVKNIYVVFPYDRKKYTDMVRLLRNLGYSWTEARSEILVFKLSEVLKNEALFRNGKSKNVMSLGEFKNRRDISQNALKDIWLHSKVNIWELPLVQVCKEMDNKCSMVVMEDEEICAFVLGSEFDGRVTLRYLACDKGKTKYLAPVLASAVKATEKKYGEDVIIETTVINDDARRIFKRLVTEYGTRKYSALKLKIRE